ncbi:unnamed protein product [Caretta caretta]
MRSRNASLVLAVIGFLSKAGEDCTQRGFVSTDGVFRVQLSIDVPKQPAHSDKDHFKNALFLYMLAYHNKVFAGRQQTGIPTTTTSTERKQVCWKQNYILSIYDS